MIAVTMAYIHKHETEFEGYTSRKFNAKKKKTLDKEKICAWEAIHSVISLSTGDR
jgi:hypothetical protein